MCLELLRRHWSRPGLETFGKRGERQYGIDILDLSGETPVHAAQCKLKEEHKSLQPGEIQTEVDEAKKFPTPLGKYAILTTAKVSTQSQMKVRDINQTHKAQGLFEVELRAGDPKEGDTGIGRILAAKHSSLASRRSAFWLSFVGWKPDSRCSAFATLISPSARRGWVHFGAALIAALAYMKAVSKLASAAARLEKSEGNFRVRSE